MAKKELLIELEELFEDIDKETILLYLGNYYSSSELEELVNFIKDEQGLPNK